MRHYPVDDSDRDDATEIGAKPWMLQALCLNPSYVSWGPHEDYMVQQPGRNYGWQANAVFDTWDTLHKSLQPDELNVIANFYFEIERDSKACETCHGKGDHPDAQWVTESWYRHTSPFTVPNMEELQTKAIMERICGGPMTVGTPGRSMTVDSLAVQEMIRKYGEPFRQFVEDTIRQGGYWGKSITQDEADALWEEKRLGLEFKEKPTAEMVNLWASQTPGMGHDAINKWICEKRRIERLGLPYHCEACQGRGYHYTIPEPYMNLILWVLHPRKGASRAVTVQHIKEEEVKLVVAYLKKCHKVATQDIWKRIIRFPYMPPLSGEERKKAKQAREQRKKDRKQKPDEPQDSPVREDGRDPPAPDVPRG